MTQTLIQNILKFIQNFNCCVFSMADRNNNQNIKQIVKQIINQIYTLIVTRITHPFLSFSNQLKLPITVFKKNSLQSFFVFNLAGQALPLLVGLVTIPKLILYLGVERFGALSVVWVLIGYFSLFDFGLSRTLTYLSAQHFITKNWDDLRKTFWSIIALIFITSLIGSSIILIFKYFNFFNYIKSTTELKLEISESLIPIALSIPIVSSMTALKGLFEADEKFFIVNFLQVLLGIYTFVSPLLLPKEYLSLNSIVYLIMFGRFVFFIIYILIILKNYPQIRLPQIYQQKAKYKMMLSYGGWLTLSNLINPFMVYLDRFFLSLIVPTHLIAYYTTPYEMISRLLIIPASLSRTLFPRLSRTTSLSEIKQIKKKSLLATFLIMGSITILIVTTSRWLLNLWLGPEFAAQSTLIMITLMLGVFINSLSYTPYTHLQSKGRSDITTKLHLAELPLYLILFYFLTLKYNILGAALAWSFRFCIDTILLFYLDKKTLAKSV